MKATFKQKNLRIPTRNESLVVPSARIMRDGNKFCWLDLAISTNTLSIEILTG